MKFYFNQSMFLFISFLFMAGCGGGGGGDGQQAGPSVLDPAFVQNVNGRMAGSEFSFSAGTLLFDTADPRRGQGAVLKVGRFDLVGQTSAFSLVSDDGSLEGGQLVAVDSTCSFYVTYRALAGRTEEKAGGLVTTLGGYFFDQCGVDNFGRLGLLDIAEGASLISQVGTQTTVDYSAAFTLSPGEVVLPPISLVGRLEHGAAEIRLAGNLLTYSVLVEGLTSGGVSDLVEEIKLQRGEFGVAGNPSHITLQGITLDPMRGFTASSQRGSIHFGSIFVTDAEADALRAGTGGFFLNFATTEVPTGLLRGQMAPLVNPIAGVTEGRDTLNSTGVLVGTNGGEVTAKGADGTSYRLVIPPEAHSAQSPLSVTVTPVNEMLGLPVSGRLVAAAKVGPDATQFDNPLTLTFDVPEGFNRKQLLAFTFSGDGSNLTFLPLLPSDVVGNQVTLRLNHFSTAGIATGSSADIPTSTGLSGSLDNLAEQSAGILTEAEAGQWLGDDQISQEIMNRIAALYFNFYDQVLRPRLLLATTLAQLDQAFPELMNWYAALQWFFDDITPFDSRRMDGLNIMATAIETAINQLDQECVNATDACIKIEKMKIYFQWLKRATRIETYRGAPLAIPAYNEFCGGFALLSPGEPVRLEVSPGNITALSGAPFQFQVQGYDANNVPVDVPAPQWAITSVASSIGPQSGGGTISVAGTYLVKVKDTTHCVDDGQAILNVRDLSGNWFVNLQRTVTCTEDNRPAMFSVLPVTQIGDTLSVYDSNYGQVNWSITNFHTVRNASNQLPYQIDSGTITSSTGQYCTDFFNDIVNTLNDRSCLPPNSCEPISCTQSDATTGTLTSDALKFTGETIWSDQLSWNLISSGVSRRVNSYCEGRDVISANK